MNSYSYVRCRRVPRARFGSHFIAAHHQQLVPEKRHVIAEMELFLAEIYLLAHYKHPHIVTATGVAWNTIEHVITEQEYMRAGDLEHLLAQQRSPGPTFCFLGGTTVGRRSGPCQEGYHWLMTRLPRPPVLLGAGLLHLSLTNLFN